MRFGSVCSGVEAASVAFSPLGWEPAWLAEVDIAASAVLAHRLGATAPEFGLSEKELKRASKIEWGDRVTNWGDMRVLPEMVAKGMAEAPDVLCGGTPCQSYSLAGRREGLDDERGQLTLKFVELADEIDDKRAERGENPCIVFWENVPGVLTDAGNAFGNFLADLAGDDEPLEPGPQPEHGRSSAHWTWKKASGVHSPKWPQSGLVVGPRRTVAWRTPDAQYFGLAQRRARVLVVASACAGFDPETVLFEFDGLRRDSAPSRKQGEAATHPLAPSLVASGRGLERAGDPRGQDPVVGMAVGSLAPQWWDGRPVSQTLDAVLHKGQTMPEKDRFPAVLQPVPILEAGARTGPSSNNKKAGMGLGQPGDPMFTLQAKAQHAVAVCDPIPFNWMADGKQTNLGFQPGNQIASTLGSNQHPAFLETLAFDTTQITHPANRSNPQPNDPCHPLAAGAHPPTVCITGDISHTLTGEGFDASEDGTGRGTPIIPSTPYAFQPRIARNGRGDMGEKVNALQAQSGETGRGDAAPCVVDFRMAVRRLMPVEAERLQGFPDGWTDVPVAGKPAADGPRYKQMGNSWPVNVIHWVGRRIDAHMRQIGVEVVTIGAEDYEWLTAP